MNELQIFKYENNDVRTVEINGEPWFVLKDVCGVLGVNNSRMVADRLDDDEKGVSQIDTLGGKQSMIVTTSLDCTTSSCVVINQKPNRSANGSRPKCSPPSAGTAHT